MLIVIEGCDGTGKTTFANVLADLIRMRLPQDEVRILHYGPPVRHPLEEYELDLEWYRPGCGTHLIIDRLHWGEAIYGPLYRGKSLLGRAGILHVDLFLSARGGVAVLLHPPVGEIRRALTRRGEDYLKSEHVDRVANEYLEMLVWSSMPRMGYPNYADKFDAEDVLRYAMLQDMNHRVLNRFPTYIGSYRPQFLLLGERRNHPTEQVHQAAFVPYGVTSGRYLLDALPVAVWESVGIANACEENVRDLWETLNYPAVVALGNTARDVCVDQKIPHGAVPHPQYVRRFYYKRQVEYGELICQAAMTQDDLRKWPHRGIEDV